MARPNLQLTLDKPRELKFPMSAMLEFEELTGKKVSGLDIIKMENTTQLLWVMLKQDDKKLTYKETVKIVDEFEGGIDTIQDAVYKVAHIAFTGKQPEKKGDLKNA